MLLPCVAMNTAANAVAPRALRLESLSAISTSEIPLIFLASLL
jgi:hypothetical protein